MLRGIKTTYYPSTSQTVTVGAASAATTNAVGAHTSVVRLHADTDCFIAIAKAPTATTSDMFLPSGQTEYIRVHPGQKVAAIQDSAAGTLYVTEMTL